MGTFFANSYNGGSVNKQGIGHDLYLIASTGGPGGGKSTMMSVLKQFLENRGFRVAMPSELATEFINAGITPWGEWPHPLLFQTFLLKFLIAREDLYAEMLRHMSPQKPMVILCDRGALDAMAYVQRHEFLDVVEHCGRGIHELRERYKAVIHLVTAADGAEEFYTLANNTARTESPEEARRLDARTKAAWLGHQHHIIIDNSTGFDQKITRALTALTRVLGMPDPLEKERKFRLLNFDPSMIPEDAVCVQIAQDYLQTTQDGPERRVRKRTIDGASSYYYTEKSPTGEKGVRIERETPISLSEYEKLLTERDPSTRTIHKVRNCFSVNNRLFELDVFLGLDLVVLEVEVGDMDEAIVFPEGWELDEVTGDTLYSNRTIAQL